MAGLADFIKQLQEADEKDVTYSIPPEQPIKVIMPDGSSSENVVDISNTQPIKIITPVIKTEIEPPKKKTISFKLSTNKPITEQNQSNNVATVKQQSNEPKLKKIEQYRQSNNNSILQPVNNYDNNIQDDNTPIVEEKPKQVVKPSYKQEQQQKQSQNKQSDIDQVEQLFRRSGTSISKKDEWYKYYQQAQASKKQNSVAIRMKQGKFAIASNGDVLILPDYDVRKDSDEILKDTWL